jgi:hypothetical protein
MRTLHAAVIAAFTLFATAATAAEPEAKPEAKAEAKPEGKKPAAAKGAAAKEVTLSGTMVCAKCSLGEGKKCQSVLKVDEGGKSEKYYLAQNEVAEQNHETVCSGETKATVTGAVKTAKGKKVLTASAIKFD